MSTFSGRSLPCVISPAVQRRIQAAGEPVWLNHFTRDGERFFGFPYRSRESAQEALEGALSERRPAKALYRIKVIPKERR